MTIVHKGPSLDPEIWEEPNKKMNGFSLVISLKCHKEAC